jgi:hypothetical protein
MILAWSGAEWANFVDAIASLAVPIVIGVALVLYRKPIRDLIGRNREAKLPGVELKFDPPDPGAIQAVKRQLPRETALDEAETDAIEAPAAVSGGGRNEDHLAVEIRDLATRDVRVAFISLIDALEDRVRDLASAVGELDPHTPRWQDLLDRLVEKGVIPKGVASNVVLLDRMSSAVVAGDARYREGDALIAIDGGLDLLIALDGIPVQGYEVVETGVVLYKDEDCTEPFTDTTGVIVRQHKPMGRKGKPQGPYPTRKSYEPGDIVGWQWTFNEAVREFFWRGPDGSTSLIRSAWFVGEHLRRPSPDLAAQ